MIYALRLEIGWRTVLVELSSGRKLVGETVNAECFHRRCDPKYARSWVRDGKLNETGLFVGRNGEVRHRSRTTWQKSEIIVPDY